MSLNQKGEKSGEILYSYDEYGNLIKEYWDFSDKWSQSFVYEYEKCHNISAKSYTSSNVYIINNSDYRIIKEYYDYSNRTGRPSDYFYNENGKLLSKRFERSDGLSTETY